MGKAKIRKTFVYSSDLGIITVKYILSVQNVDFGQSFYQVRRVLYRPWIVEAAAVNHPCSRERSFYWMGQIEGL
jgi:hypothetical protein